MVSTTEPRVVQGCFPPSQGPVKPSKRNRITRSRQDGGFEFEVQHGILSGEFHVEKFRPGLCTPGLSFPCPGRRSGSCGPWRGGAGAIHPGQHDVPASPVGDLGPAVMKRGPDSTQHPPHSPYPAPQTPASASPCDGSLSLSQSAFRRFATRHSSTPCRNEAKTAIGGVEPVVAYNPERRTW